MTHVDNEDQEDKPLDPAMENVRRKLMRLQLVSGSIMLLMFMAVLAAIVYKVTTRDGKPVAATGDIAVPSDAPLTATATLPAGFAVSAVSQDGGRILFYGVMADGARKALLFDIAAGRIVADIDVKGD